MSLYSHSRVETFNQCPFKFEMRYIAEYETLPNDDAGNPLYLGTAVHTGIEQDVETAIKQYLMSYPVVTDLQINETIKLRAMIPKAKKLLPDNLKYEQYIECDVFRGYLDAVEELQDGTVNIYDFKYSNNVDNYLKSPQLHLYKYFYELATGRKVNKLYYLFIPKTFVRQKKTEDLYKYRKRLEETLKTLEPQLIEVKYDYDYVEKFYDDIEKIETTTDFTKNLCGRCEFCEYKELCKKGLDYMILPSTERRTINKVSKKKIWIYGEAFTGKTTMLDKAPNPLNLNTDGNIQFVTMPYLAIKDEVTVTGRLTNRKFAWEVFKDTITELEKKQNDFKTIIVDLLEDTREMCRIYKYDQLGIEHESDAGYGKGWDIIKTEYLSTMRRLFNLDYENIVVISHETSDEITKSNGAKFTKIKPNLQDALANKIAGMVDIVARAVVEDDGTRTLNFKSNEYIFGGGRLTNIKETKIPLDWNALMDVYNQALGVTTPPSDEEIEMGMEELKQIMDDSPVIIDDEYEELPHTTSEPLKTKQEPSEPAEPTRKRRTRKARD